MSVMFSLFCPPTGCMRDEQAEQATIRNERNRSLDAHSRLAKLVPERLVVGTDANADRLAIERHWHFRDPIALPVQREATAFRCRGHFQRQIETADLRWSVAPLCADAVVLFVPNLVCVLAPRRDHQDQTLG